MHLNPIAELILQILEAGRKEPEPKGPPCGICGSREGVGDREQQNGPTWLLCDDCDAKYDDADLQRILWERREEDRSPLVARHKGGKHGKL